MYLRCFLAVSCPINSVLTSLSLVCSLLRRKQGVNGRSRTRGKKKNKKSPSVDPKRSKTSLHYSPKKLLYQKSYIANTPITHHTYSIFNLIPNCWAMHGCEGTRNDSKKKIWTSHFLRTVILKSGSWLGTYAVDKASPGYPCKSGLVWAV